MTSGRAPSVAWVELSSYSPPGGRPHSCQCPDGVLIRVSRLVVVGVPIVPHHLSLDLALGMTVMADSDSILDCQRRPNICHALALYTSIKEMWDS